MYWISNSSHKKCKWDPNEKGQAMRYLSQEISTGGLFYFSVGVVSDILLRKYNPPIAFRILYQRLTCINCGESVINDHK